jgi:hypothetical protein
VVQASNTKAEAFENTDAVAAAGADNWTAIVLQSGVTVPSQEQKLLANTKQGSTMSMIWLNHGRIYPDR